MSEVIDNKANRIRVLKDIIKHLHAGNPPEQVRGQMQEIVRQTDASEFMAMEQELMAEGMPVEEVRAMCDLHSKVTRDVLVQIPIRKAVAPGHPVDTFRRENEALRGVIAALTTTLAELQGATETADAAPIVLRFRQSYNELMDIDKHYQRKEHALFSCLERHGITGPSKVMWAKDDDVRNLLKRLGECLRPDPAAVEKWKMNLFEATTSALKAVQEMIYKREHTASNVIGDAVGRRVGRDMVGLSEIRLVHRGTAGRLHTRGRHNARIHESAAHRRSHVAYRECKPGTTGCVSAGLFLSTAWAQTGAKSAAGQSLSVAALSASTDNLLNGGPSAWNQIAVKHVALNRTPPLYDTDEPAALEISTVDVRLARVSKNLLVQLCWRDPTHDAITLAEVPNTAPETRFRKVPTEADDRFFDAAAVMFPAKSGSGAVAPSLQMGDAEHPVEIYYWNATRGAMLMQAQGRGTTRRLGQTFPASSTYQNGQWNVIFELPDLPAGTTVAFAVWNGSQKDRDGRKYFSVWQVLE